MKEYSSFVSTVISILLCTYFLETDSPGLLYLHKISTTIYIFLSISPHVSNAKFFDIHRFNFISEINFLKNSILVRIGVNVGEQQQYETGLAKCMRSHLYRTA
jgi:hypothetical protein